MKESNREGLVVLGWVASFLTILFVSYFQGSLPLWLQLGTAAWFGFQTGLVRDRIDASSVLHPGNRSLEIAGFAIAVFTLGFLRFSRTGLPVAVLASVEMGGAYLVGRFRVPILLLEIPFQWILYLLERFLGVPTLRLAPVLFHRAGRLPHYGLGAHLLLVAPRDPDLVRRVLAACAASLGQRAIGEEALATLQAREIESCLRQHHYGPLIELQGQWLPGVAGAPPLLLGVRDAVRYLAAAESAASPYHRLQHVERASRAFQSVDNQRLADLDPLGLACVPTFRLAAFYLGQLRDEAKSAADSELPNPFRAGDPLSPEEGRELFLGREELIRRIEKLLADPKERGSIALIGPRRCGKTSLLKMLPSLLPDTVCIFFDLQDNPVDSPRAFFAALARRTREQAQRDRRLDLPPLPDGPAFESGSAWFQSLEEAAGDRRILLCIDEFERLEELFPGDRSELLKLMGLFRATIQHRRKLRLLVAGAATFDEMGDLWNDHFINAREIRVEFLERDTTLQLLTRPIAAFPADAVPSEIAETIFERTGGQPYLVQLYGHLLVSHLNDRKRRRAVAADLEPVEREVLAQGANYFRYLYPEHPTSDRLQAEKTALETLAAGNALRLDERTRRWLQRRCLVTGDDRLRVPVLAEWIREHS